jgi:uncharacterized protein (DUF2461 family)
MDYKLTIKLDLKVIEEAKNYARQRKTSLSKLIESYLQHLTSGSPQEKDDVTPLVKSLSGIVRDSNWEEAEQSYKDHLKKKYSSDHD